MPLASEIILDQLAEDGYSLSEIGWIRAGWSPWHGETRTTISHAGNVYDVPNDARIG